LKNSGRVPQSVLLVGKPRVQVVHMSLFGEVKKIAGYTEGAVTIAREGENGASSRQTVFAKSLRRTKLHLRASMLRHAKARGGGEAWLTLARQPHKYITIESEATLIFDCCRYHEHTITMTPVYISWQKNKTAGLPRPAVMPMPFRVSKIAPRAIATRLGSKLLLDRP